MTVKDLEKKLGDMSKKHDEANAALKAEIAELKALFQSKIDNLTAKLELSESTVAIQKTTIENLKNQISSQGQDIEEVKVGADATEGKANRSEQYLRRPNLRINGVVLPDKRDH